MVIVGSAPFLRNLRKVLLLAETQLTLDLMLHPLTVVRALLLLVTEKVPDVVTVWVMVLALVLKVLNLNMLIGLP